jgi:two-component system, response regulator / RNA-binding antiterminator
MITAYIYSISLMKFLMLKVMIVDNDLERTKPLKQSLLDTGYKVVAHLKDTINLDDACCEFQPDIVIIDTDSPSRDTLENICVMTMNEPRPIMMFTHNDDKEQMKLATKAGVCAYVVGSIPNERLRPVIDAAIVRFEEFKSLRKELSEANIKLSERKVIEQAKGLLMKQRKIDEDEAYSMLRTMAMQKNMRIGTLSKQIVQAAELLL